MTLDYLKYCFVVFLFCFLGTFPLDADAQDSVIVSLEDFIQRGLDNSGQVDFEKQSVELAKNNVDKTRDMRYLPKFELNTQHGAVPGVKSDTQLPDDELYMDPDLENDWENWAIFTRAEINAVQPIYTFGALSNAVNAAKAGAEAAKQQFESKQADIKLRLYELYNSYLLAMEMERLLEEANQKIKEVENAINKKKKEGDADLDESELFKFEIFKSEFAIRTAEVKENLQYVKNIWDYVLKPDNGTVYLPETEFLEPVANKVNQLNYYKTQALQQRAEIKGIEATIEAAQYGIKATRARNLPSLFIGLTGRFANTPNRPRQSNPFIINNTNFLSAGVGLGIRQNLDFFSAKNEIQHRKIQYRKAKFLKSAAIDGIMLELNEKYKEANLSEVRIDKTDEAWVTSKKWLRQEQLDYDFGIGDTKDLIDAMKKELELRVQLKQHIFDFNKDMAALYKTAGIPLVSLKMK